MEQNFILAGVGGQGILTIARAISIAAMHRDLHLKQAEVHGMSQRGGAVQSHLRIADHELFSDLIPAGQADIIFSVEPLEALRYVQYLRENGVMIVSTNAFINIENYPAIEQILDRIAEHPQHVLLDVDGLAKAAGSARAANIIVLGAGSLFLELDAQDLEDAVAEMFAAKGDKIVATNRRAFRLGRNAAAAYRDGLQRGGTSRAVRSWIDGLSADELLQDELPVLPALDELDPVENRLTGAEAMAFERALLRAYEEERRPLYEHEIYMLVELVGAISPPRYVFLPKGGMIPREALAKFPSKQVVLKIVSQDVIHKSDADGIVFAKNDYETVSREVDRLVARHDAAARVEGVLVVECVERTSPSFGNELFVGVRATREFGPVIAAGIGGVDTEYLASKMRPGLAVAKACAMDTSAAEFLELFKTTAAYDVLAGRTRGHTRIVSDGELLRCFRAFISIARHFCVDRGAVGPDVAELEVNPFAFRHERMVPLDGRGRLGTAAHPPAVRPLEKVQRLLEPRAIGVLGVSSTAMNFGRIILNNVKNCGFPTKHMHVIKENEKEIDGVKCVASVADLPEFVDMLVIAAPAPAMPQITTDVINSGKVGAAIMIPGGLGETEGSEEIEQQIRAVIVAGREKEDGGPVFLGPNCMGIQSRPGQYDTFFIPQNKLDSRWSAPARRVALISQSGAFIISRQSNLESLDAALTISLGNQIDLTLADLVQAVGQRDDIDVLGVYAEGFNNLDGLDMVRAIRKVSEAAKVVIFYKAGRTPSGRSAAAGHTASVAGDYDVCLAAAANAGALVVETFKEFEQTVELATALHGKQVRGLHLGAVSNAGYETVGMADATVGRGYHIEMATLSDTSKGKLSKVLAKYKLDKLVNARNPLDLTPMASDEAYEECVRVILESPEVDALVASLVPLSPAMLTTPDEIEQPGSLVERLPKLFAAADKPVIVSIDSGSLYEPMAQAIRAAGVPVFRSCDQAVRSLGRYLCHRAPEPLAAETSVKLL
ncbi:MAG: indolepyruvate oxidoreductase subunit beta [Phycisphaerae bacterium]|nr:indolepyruvate oxidoreductase subunit beta [Phycisphaerae bacterium]